MNPSIETQIIHFIGNQKTLDELEAYQIKLGICYGELSAEIWKAINKRKEELENH